MLPLGLSFSVSQAVFNFPYAAFIPSEILLLTADLDDKHILVSWNTFADSNL